MGARSPPRLRYKAPMARHDDRTVDQLRPVRLETGFVSSAAGSCLVSFGRTRVLCVATVDGSTPKWLAGRGQGWVTAEYSMLPGCSNERVAREAAKGKIKGRTYEIQRLIARSLRACVDLTALGERQVIVDCDVIEADGGTRTASITGGYVALALALRSIEVAETALIRSVSAVSCGIVGDDALLDLDYSEDHDADVDMNFVITDAGGLVEVQGTAEGDPFSVDDLQSMLGLAQGGCARLTELQRKALAAAQ